MAESRLHQLSALGQSVWIDSLSRDLLHTGGLARMMEEDAVTGVTSNPTIFQKAISQGDAYDDQLRDLLEHEDDPREIFFALAGRDIREACDLLRAPSGTAARGPARLRLARGRPDARARHGGDDRAGAAARRPGRQAEPLREDPGDEGRPAGDRGDDRARRADQRDADLLARALRARWSRPTSAALERLVEAGGDPAHGHLGRELLRLARRHRGRQAARRDRQPESCRASSRSRTPSSPTRTSRRSSPASAGRRSPAQGASKQCCLWASTSTKNPDYRDVLYVEELIGPDTVNTMPQETIEAFQDHGNVARDARPGRRRGARASSRSRGGRRRLRRRHRDARARGRREVRRLLRGAARRHPREAQRAGQRVIATGGARRADLGARPDRLDRARRGAVARLAGRAAPDARARRGARASSRTSVAAPSTTSSCSAWAGRALAPEVLRRTFERDALPRARHDAPEGDPRASPTRSTSTATLFVVSSKSGGTLETRSHLDFFWERGGGAPRSSSRSPTRARRSSSSRTSAGFRASSPASRRSAAATRRSRRSGSSRRR